MSPSSSGHRLGLKRNHVTLTDMSSITKNCNSTNESLNQTLMQFKDISSSVKVIDKISSSNSAKKTGRKIVFQNESTNESSVSQNDKNTCVLATKEQNTLDIINSQKSSNSLTSLISDDNNFQVLCKKKSNVTCEVMMPSLKQTENPKIVDQSKSYDSTKLLQSESVDPSTVILVCKGGNVLMVPNEDKFSKIDTSNSTHSNNLLIQQQSIEAEQLANSKQTGMQALIEVSISSFHFLHKIIYILG